MQSHLWCPNDPRGQGIDDDDDGDDDDVLRDPFCHKPQDFLNGVDAADDVGVQYRTSVLQEGSQERFVGYCFCIAATDA